MYLTENLQSSKIDITGDWNHIRFGDAIGMAALAQSLSFHYGRDVKFYHEPKFPTVEQIFKYTDPYLVRGACTGKLTTLRASCWAHWDFNSRYFDQHLYLKNPHVAEYGKNKVLINPLFDAPYNIDRNWTPNLFTVLVQWYLNHGWTVTVTGVESVVEPHLKIMTNQQLVRRLYNDVSKTMRACCTTDVYIGGDTGMTHFASAMSNYPRRIIAIFGDGSEHRHNIKCKNFSNVVDMSKCADVRNTFIPKVNKHKKLYYTMQKHFDIKEMVTFLMDTSTQGFKRSSVFSIITDELKGIKSQKKILAFFDGNDDAIYDIAKIARSGYIVLPTVRDKVIVDYFLSQSRLDSPELKTIACSAADFKTIFERRPWNFNLGIDNGIDDSLGEYFNKYSKSWIVLR